MNFSITKSLFMKLRIFGFVAFAFLLFANNSIAQKTKEEKQKEKAKQITTIVADSQHYVFVAQTAFPVTGSMRNLTGGYDVIVSKDTVNSYLPYFGKAYSGIDYGSTTSPLEFISTKFIYTSKATKKADGWNITIETKDQNDGKKLMFNIYDNGSATLLVTTTNRSQITFHGNIEAVKPKK